MISPAEYHRLRSMSHDELFNEACQTTKQIDALKLASRGKVTPEITRLNQLHTLLKKLSQECVQTSAGRSISAEGGLVKREA